MATTANDVKTTKVVTGLVRFSYAKVWEADENGKYGVSLIIPKSDTKTINAIKQAIEAAKESGKTKWGGKIPAKLDLDRLRDGDEERPDDEAYANSYFINCSAKTKPGIVDKYKNKISEQDEFYSGCYGYASINLFPYDSNGNKGVGCGLNNLMKIKDGDALGGRSSAESDFATVEVEEDFSDM